MRCTLFDSHAGQEDDDHDGEVEHVQHLFGGVRLVRWAGATVRFEVNRDLELNVDVDVDVDASALRIPRACALPCAGRPAAVPEVRRCAA